MALTQPDTPVSVAHIVVRYVRECGPVNVEALGRRLAPLGGQQETAARQTVSALIDIGVLESEDELLRASDKAAAAVNEPVAILDCLFANTDVSALWGKQGDSLALTGGVDLVRALAWFLTLDAFDGPYSFDKGGSQIAARQSQELGDRVIVNDTRWIPFTRWASYLGLGRLSNHGLAVDPTKALRWVLQDESQQQDSWTHYELISLLARRLPVLQSGDFADSIRERQAEHGVESDAEADFSPALTLAVCVLRGLDLIDIDEGTGDASKARFTNNLGAVHQISWKGDSRG